MMWSLIVQSRIVIGMIRESMIHFFSGLMIAMIRESMIHFFSGLMIGMIRESMIHFFSGLMIGMIIGLSWQRYHMIHVGMRGTSEI